MHLPPRSLGFLLALFCGVQVRAQTPIPADPTKKNPPAEIVPPKPELRPPAGQKVLEPEPPAPLSPGTPAVAAEVQESPQQTALKKLSREEIDRALALLKEQFIAADAVSELELKRATLQGLLLRLGSGATINPPPVAPPAASPVRSEVIEGRTGYLRLGSLNRENLAELDRALESFSANHLGAVVLDLRAMPPGLEAELAAEVCRRFAPKGKALFSVARRNAKDDQIYTSKADPKYRGLLLILVDAASAGDPEVIAGVLRAQAQAIIIGQRTKGEAAEFTTERIADQLTLRFAVAEARLPDGGALLSGGVLPDVAVEAAPELLKEVLKREGETGVASLLVESPRVRMNEAALVAGLNPEIDAVQAAQRLRGERSKPVLRDEMLLRALDLVTSLAILKP